MSRSLVAVAMVAGALAGCFGEGLQDSARDCEASVPVDAGLEVVVAEAGRFAGYCMSLRSGETVMIRSIPAEGSVWFPLEAPTQGYVSAQVAHEGDRYCADQLFANFDYDGDGIRSVVAESSVVCA